MPPPPHPCAVIDKSFCTAMQSCAVDPGAVSSNIYANSQLPSPIRWFIRNMHAPTRDGASAVLHAATTPWPPVTPQHAQQYKPQPRELRVNCCLSSAPPSTPCLPAVALCFFPLSPLPGTHSHHKCAAVYVSRSRTTCSAVSSQVSVHSHLLLASQLHHKQHVW